MKRVFKLKKGDSYTSDIAKFLEDAIASNGSIKKDYKVDVNVAEVKKAKPVAKAKAKPAKAKKKK